MSILDQLSSNYGKLTPAAMEGNNNTMHRPYSAANPPELLFCWIEECAEIALLGRDLCDNVWLLGLINCEYLAADCKAFSLARKGRQ
jgi:hypothetical protein